ncbi:MAG: hypothetical protein M1331_03245 [Candidatus Marsarchaeota archaeon]|nr:hypothetical protein [Candidatus Marsarchaeota archaeon]
MALNQDPKAISRLVIRQASTSLSIKSLISKIRMLGGESMGFAQLFDPDSILDKSHLIASYLNALEAFNENQNSSKSMAMEMLLFASFTRQIDRAVLFAGAKEGMSFVLFSDSRELYRKIKPFLTADSDFIPKTGQIAKCAKKLGIEIAKNQKSMEIVHIQLFQKVTVSKIKD